MKKIVGNSYCQDYLQNQNKAFLPLIISTSGRLHGEFVRLLYLLAHGRALTFFTSLGYEPCYEDLCQRRGSSLFQHRALIGLCWHSSGLASHGWQRAVIRQQGSPTTSSASRAFPRRHGWIPLNGLGRSLL